MTRMLRIGAALAAVVAMTALAGCTPAEPYAAPEVKRTVAPAAKDRPLDEVREASAAIDPCALLDERVAAEQGITGPRVRGLFECRIEEGVIATVYTPHGQGERFWQERFDLDGAVAYRSSAVLKSCDVVLPTSFGTAMRFSQYQYDAPYDCEAVEAFAAAAVEALREHPQSLLRAGGGDAIIACDAFEAAIGGAPKGTSFRARSLTGGGDGLDSCGLWDDPDDAGFQNVDPRSSLWLRLRAPLPEFSSRDGWQDNEKIQVAGREAMTVPDDGSCDLFFDVRASRENEGKVIGAVVTAEDCDQAADLMARMLPEFDASEAPSGDGVGELLYTDGASDSPAVGACADALNQADRECTPFVKTEVPAAPVDRLSRGAVDANVLCAAAAPAVHDRLGDELRPVTVIQAGAAASLSAASTLIPKGAQMCEFVSPSHSVMVRIAASLQPLAEVRKSLAEAQKAPEAEYADHTASVQTAKDAHRSTAWIAFDEADRPGHLVAEVQVMPDRKDGLFNTSPIDEGPTESFDLIAGGIAKAVLGG